VTRESEILSIETKKPVAEIEYTVERAV